MDAKTLQSIKLRYGIVGNCNGLNRALEMALQVAHTDLAVLITGESGVGKEVLPHIIHDNSERRGRKYLAVNCGSIPEGTIDSELFGHEKGSFTGAIGEHAGYFGMADGGTLFLDEVGELPLSTQARLLRVLETGEYLRVGGNEVRKTNVRIVAATNVNMQNAIRDGKFREDLYYRLCGINIKMPPLRERGEDIILLFKKFAMETADKYRMLDRLTLSPDAEEVIKRYKWPGNVRQLRNLVEKLSIMMVETRTVTPEILSENEIWATTEEQGGLVHVGHNGSHNDYHNDREMFLQLIQTLSNELRDLKQQVAQLSQQPHTRHMPEMTPVPEATPFAEEYVEESLDVVAGEKNLIQRALERHDGNRAKAAEELHISERTLYRKIKKYGLENP